MDLHSQGGVVLVVDGCAYFDFGSSGSVMIKKSTFVTILAWTIVIAN